MNRKCYLKRNIFHTFSIKYTCLSMKIHAKDYHENSEILYYFSFITSKTAKTHTNK